MLISPPFLPPRNQGQSENDWLHAAMIEGTPGDGAFPVSFSMGWHGGVHLTAPVTAGKSEPVRAISDGEVIFLRKATSRNSTEDHPLNYRGGWTDDGCVIIRHQTCIGSGVNASDICFFSIYMHLAEIDLHIKTGRRISRKDPIGYAGQIYGSLTRQIHFEIVSDEANAKKTLGRLSGNLDITKDGRIDAVYGDVYFHLPAGTNIYDVEPIKYLVEAKVQPKRPNKKSPLPPIIALQASITTTQPIIVGLASQPGVPGSGDVKVTTYQLDGEIISAPLCEPKRDYRLIFDATDMSKHLPYKTVTAASAILEILRFGRIINCSKESLGENEVPNWQLISLSSGKGWVDLNAKNVTKFSDADFPQWRKWNILDDSTDKNSRCDSTLIKSWLSSTGTEAQLSEAQARLSLPHNVERLSRAICKFPSEWSSDTIDERWAWLKHKSPTLPVPLSEDDFKKLKSHITALCVDLPVINQAQWHFPPLHFIRQFRTCGWLSKDELVRCIPAVYKMERSGRGSKIDLIRISDEVAKQRVDDRDPIQIMQIFRKYAITSPVRIAHFLSQIFRETGLLQWIEEIDSGEKYEGRADLNNKQKGDGKRFKGRGFIQITGRRNYDEYSRYRGKVGNESFLIEPNNEEIAKDAYNAIDTAGVYWASHPVGSGAININSLADAGVSDENIRAVTKAVNGQAEGIGTALVERQGYFYVLTSVLLDDFPSLGKMVERKYV